MEGGGGGGPFSVIGINVFREVHIMLHPIILHKLRMWKQSCRTGVIGSCSFPETFQQTYLHIHLQEKRLGKLNLTV